MFTLPDRYNVSTLLDHNLEAGRGAKPVFFHGDDTITYCGLLRNVCGFGRALRERGIRRENRVLLALADTPAFPIAFFAAIRMGAVPVPVNPLSKTEDLLYYLEDTDALAVVADPANLSTVEAAVARLPQQVPVISAAELPDLIAAHGGDLAPANTHRDDIAFLQYSSGSTGRPKGVVHLHRDIPFTCESYARHVLDISSSDVVLSRALFHGYGLGNAVSFPVWAGAAAVLVSERPSPGVMLDAIERYRPTIFCSVPTFYNAILNAPDARGKDLSCLRLCISAAEPLPAEIWRRWKEAFGHSILDGIGSTEMLHIFCSNTWDHCRPGSAGKPVPGYELAVVCEDGRPAKPGKAGSLLVKGASAAPYYWRNQESSRHVMRGDWTLTGDRFRVDEDGYYWYEGRLDDMLKIGGEWVSPIQIENTLIEHPAVQEAAVVGVQMEGLNRIKAAVVLETSQSPSAELTRKLQEWCKARLLRYQYPHLIEYRSALPKTSAGKLQRFRVRDPEGVLLVGCDAVGR